MKKSVITIISMIMIVLLLMAACGQKAEAPKTEEPKAQPAAEEPASTPDSGGMKKVAFICKSYADAWCVRVKDEMERIYAEENYADKFELHCFDAQADTTILNNQISNCVANGFDVIQFQMLDEHSPLTVVKEALDQGVIVIVNTGHLADAGETYYIDASPKEQGEVLAAFAALNLPQDAKVGVLAGLAGTPHCVLRQEGIEEVLAAERPDVKLVDVQHGDWAKANGLTITENWLSAFSDLNAVMSHCDCMAMGALEAIKMAGIPKDKIQIYGIAGSAEACAAIIDGDFMGTVLQSETAFAENGLVFFEKAVKGEPITSMIVESVLITSDNVNQFI